MDAALQLTVEQLKELKTDVSTGQDRMENSISAMSSGQRELTNEMCAVRSSQVELKEKRQRREAVS
jgi:hypothetical protein